MSTVSECISKTSQATALIIPSKQNQDGLEVTYQGLADHISSFQTRLAQLGLQHGEAVSIILPNTYPFIVAFLAATYQRLRAAPLNSAYKEAEFDFYFRDLTPALIIVPQGAFESRSPAVTVAQTLGIAIAECYWHGDQVALDIKCSSGLDRRSAQPLAQAEPDDVALVLHTSGTTGRPKAVPLSHRNLTRTMKNIQATYELTPQDRTMIVMPLFHVHGIFAGLLAPLISGGSAIVPESFHATTFWDDFIKYEANWYTAVPTIHTILLRNPHPNPLPQIRFIRSSSAALSPTTFHALEKAFNAPVLESYGMTEATHQIASNPLPCKGKRRPGSVGLSQGGVEIRILDKAGNEMPAGTDAEICIRGENIMAGYIDNPTANASSFTKDGFFRTGDQGRKDSDGYVTITGRMKEMINRAGEKISPTEIDQLVLTCPAVSEACSFAIPSEIYGEEIGLAVVLKDSTGNITEEYIREYVRERAVRFKVPKRIWIINHLPKTPTGKVQRLAVGKAMLALPSLSSECNSNPTQKPKSSSSPSPLDEKTYNNEPSLSSSIEEILTQTWFDLTAPSHQQQWSQWLMLTGTVTVLASAAVVGLRALRAGGAGGGLRF